MSRPGDNLKRLTDLYRTMARIRAFEETALEAHKAGEIPGPLHVSIGQEAVAAGICINLRIEDRLTSNHRGHGHAIAKGADPQRMMAELYGRATGYCRGKGGSMHIADFSVGMLGANGVVAGGIPIAVGAAQGLKLQKSDAIVDLPVRRRRGQSRAVPRGAQLGGAVPAARAVRVRGQRRCGLHPRRERDGRAGRVARAQALRRRGDQRRRQRRDRGRRSGCRRAVAAVRRGDGPALPARAHLPPAWATPRPTPRRGARPTRSRRRARATRSRGSPRVLTERGVAGEAIEQIDRGGRRPRWRRRAAARRRHRGRRPAIAFDDVQDTGAVAWRSDA